MQQESIIFTDAAANKVGALLQDEDNHAMHLRVYVTGGGCAGFQYGFSFDESKDEVDDFEFNQDFESDEDYKSPGWIRYQKRIK